MASLFSDVLQSLPGVSALSDTGSALIAFFTTITDGKMWRSLGWIILGVLLMAAGIGLWLKSAATGLVSSTLGQVG
jgi:hypothetical protein